MNSTPIEHIIVLMLENRSFDHMCGYWDRLPSGSGLTGEEFNQVVPADTSTPKIFVHRKKLDTEQRDQPEPGHYLENALAQLFGSEEGPYSDPAPMNGFVKDYIGTLEQESKLKDKEQIDSVEAGISWSVYAGEKLTSNVGFALEKFVLFLKPEPHSGPYRKEPLC